MTHPTHRLLHRSLIAACWLALAAAAFFGGWRWLEARVLRPSLGKLITTRIEQRIGWRLRYQGISGSVVGDLRLHQVRFEPVRANPSFRGVRLPVAFVAEELRADYTLLDVLRGQVRRIDAAGARLLLGSASIALSVSRVGDLTTITCPMQPISLEALAALFPHPALQYGGRLEIEGQGFLRGLQPQFIRIRAAGSDVYIGWDDRAWTDRLRVALTLEGPPEAPLLDGVIDVHGGTWRGALPGGRATGGRARPAYLAAADRFPGTIRVDLRGSNIDVQTDQLKARVLALLRMEKARAAHSRLTGVLEALDGTYAIRGQTFRLLSGTIRFPGHEGAQPQVHALLETHVKRYQIRVAVSGTLGGESQLHLSSRPELARQDIVALLAFGRPLAGLTDTEREQVTAKDEASQVLDALLLGRAELIAARWLGLDEINVNFSPPDPSAPGAPGSPVESVEVGKYVIPDRLFGSYKIEPPQTPTDAMKHTVGAEYQLTDRLSVEGTVKAQLQDPNVPTVSTQQTPSKRHLEAEEALIRFRWKF